MTFAGTYRLPVGKGERLLNRSGWLDEFVGGWELNAVTYYQSGFPLAIIQTNLNSTLGSAVQRPNINPGVSAATGGNLYSRVTGYINSNAFTTAPQFTFGNSPKASSLRAPRSGSGNWDTSLHKNVAVLERVNVALRIDARNVFNHPWFAAPSTTLGSSTFGKITSTYNTPRAIQVGGRITF